MLEKTKITVEVTVKASMQKAWDYWVLPAHIVEWCFASEDWECPKAENNPVIGGKFNTRMSAKDGSFGFDFSGIYNDVIPHQSIIYTMDGNDARKVNISFKEKHNGINIVQIFEAENIHSHEQQKEGWQAIMNNYKKLVESKL